MSTYQSMSDIGIYSPIIMASKVAMLVLPLLTYTGAYPRSLNRYIFGDNWACARHNIPCIIALECRVLSTLCICYLNGVWCLFNMSPLLLVSSAQFSADFLFYLLLRSSSQFSWQKIKKSLNMQWLCDAWDHRAHRYRGFFWVLLFDN